MRSIIVALGLAMLGGATPASAMDQNTLRGAWIITWADDAANQNPVMIVPGKPLFEGGYLGDHLAERCGVSGNGAARRDGKQGVTMDIWCPTWNAALTGVVSPDQTSVTGTYTRYEGGGRRDGPGASGPFRMDRSPF